MSVSQLSSMIKSALVQSLPATVRVVGEVSNFSNRTHWFFSLKDEVSAMRCVCFSSSAQRVRFDLKDGMQVVCSGRIDYYDASGQLQLYVNTIEPVGEGRLEQRYRQLCEELRKAGYFDDETKKRLPVLPRKIAVVTSRKAAALQDVINTASKRWGGCRLFLYDVQVQGEMAAPQIARAINTLSRDGAKHGIDAILLTRGGGSIEDLWAFNEREVADAVFNCSLPVVAAIGHETDTTIAELVADMRCSTPTQAAMTVVADAEALQRQVDQMSQRLELMLKRNLQHNRQRLDAVMRHPIFRRPQYLVESQRERTTRLAERLQGALPRMVLSNVERLKSFENRLSMGLPRVVGACGDRLKSLERTLDSSVSRRMKVSADRLDALRRQLQAVGPMNVLSRGFTYTLGPDGHLIREAAAATEGDQITTVFGDGKVKSRVEEKQVEQNKPVVSKPLRKKKSGTKQEKNGDQASLF